MISKKKILQKWSIAFKVIPFLFLIVVLKLTLHWLGYEVLELNTLFTSLVAGTIFIIGFLVSGVLSDYKESEKLPSELSSCINALYDDIFTIYKSKHSEAARQFLDFHYLFTTSIIDWFYKKEKTKSILINIHKMNEFIIGMDLEGIQPNYIIKMKNEQNALRKIFLRIDTIRDTEFISSAYAIVEFMGLLIALSMMIIKIQPFSAALFFTLLITFLISYMVLLIKDLDNPFDYLAKGETGTEISLKPLHDLEREIAYKNETRIEYPVF
ncbi:MAG: hypothetical protein ABI761_06805 [Saprospiraceae bacterium]